MSWDIVFWAAWVGIWVGYFVWALCWPKNEKPFRPGW